MTIEEAFIMLLMLLMWVGGIITGLLVKQILENQKKKE